VSEPIVDVGIPTRNRPEYLRDAVASVLGQTFGAFRLTVSENGTGSAEVAAALGEYLADERLHHVVQGRDLGPAGNYSSLVRSGTAPYVALLHDDDRWEPEFLERRVAFLEEHPRCGLVFSGCMIIDGSGAVVDVWEPEIEPGVYPPAAFLPVIYGHNVVPVPTVVVRRTAYEAVGHDFERSLVFDDHNMWLRIASRFDVARLDGLDASYRVHGDQTSADEAPWFGEHRLQFLDAADRLVEKQLPRSVRNRARAEAHVSAASDAYERGERGRALSHLLRGAVTAPSVLGRRPAFRRASLLAAVSVLGSGGRDAWRGRREYGRRQARAAAARRVAHVLPGSPAGSPDFTVVIAARNAARTLRATLESVWMQTERSFEVILVDDGSEDRTVEVASSFASDGRLRIVSQETRGVSAARNAGIAAARGRLVSVLDADDLWLPDYLATMREAFDAAPQSGFAFTDAWVFDEPAGRIRRRFMMAPRRPSGPIPTDPLAFLRLLLEGNFVYTSVTLLLDVLRSVGGYDERLGRSEDYELWLRLSARGHAATWVPGPLAVYRLGPGTLSSDAVALARSEAHVYEIVADEYGLPDELRAVARRRALEAADDARHLATRPPASWPLARSLVSAARRAVPDPKLFLYQTPPEVAGAFPDLVRRPAGS
jgi:glycosyltransferase involved in cell wall biosynthesis